MAGLLKLSRFIDALNERIGRAAAWVVLVTVLLSAFGAIVRYADKYIGTSLSRNEYNEAQWYLYSIGFMLMGAYTLKNGGHVRVDILSNALPKRTQLWIECLFSFLFVFFVYAVVMVLSWDFVARSVVGLENSPDAGGLPRFVIKPFLLVGMFLVSAQGLSEAIKAFAKLRGIEGTSNNEDALKGAV